MNASAFSRLVDQLAGELAAAHRGRRYAEAWLDEPGDTALAIIRCLERLEREQERRTARGEELAHPVVALGRLAVEGALRDEMALLLKRGPESTNGISREHARHFWQAFGSRVLELWREHAVEVERLAVEELGAE